MSDETITLAIDSPEVSSPFPGNWVGEKPPVPCNKATGLCGYLRCHEEGHCLQAPRVKWTK